MFYSVPVSNLPAGGTYMQRYHDDNGEFEFQFEYERDVEFIECSFVPYLNLSWYEVNASITDEESNEHLVKIEMIRGNEWIENFYVTEKVTLPFPSSKVTLKFKLKDEHEQDGSPVGLEGVLYGSTSNPPPYAIKAGKISTAMTIDEIVKQHNLLVDDIAMINSLIK